MRDLERIKLKLIEFECKGNLIVFEAGLSVGIRERDTCDSDSPREDIATR
jgi:hypothetical protein